MKDPNYPTVCIVKVGTLTLEPTDLAGSLTIRCKHELGVGGGSTVTLIRSDRTILVDTGFDFEDSPGAHNVEQNSQQLLFALRRNGVVPDQIDGVFISHWHKDHFGNLSLFPHAQRFASERLCRELPDEGLVPLGDGEEIATGARMILTPGHTDGHASVIVGCRLGGVAARVAIAGDAIISYGDVLAGRIWTYNADFFDRDRAVESVSRFFNQADIVIPGHGTPFSVTPHLRKMWEKTIHA
ncbi:MAG: 4-pyridoxolactonase [Syntrophorhabdus sp. PtaU1.Bin050]|nr:MAG: 4-pyridoxolactonase [Syntrophorhabdus sp. PtaU1.Bin050]